MAMLIRTCGSVLAVWISIGITQADQSAPDKTVSIKNVLRIVLLDEGENGKLAFKHR